MKNPRMIVLALSTLLMFACNFPLFMANPAPPSNNPPVAFSPTAPSGLPIPPLPAFTLPPTLVPASGAAQLTPASTAINCRSGPDVGYDVTDAIAFGQTALIIGRNSDSSWWLVRDPNNPTVSCWVSASVVTTSGSLAGVPYVAPPPTPVGPVSGIVTKVTVDVSPSSGVCPGPMIVDFSGTITTNGPANVKYQWEITGDANNTTSSQTLKFNKAAEKDAPDPGAYKTSCGHFTVTLHVTSPNDISAKKKFSIP